MFCYSRETSSNLKNCIRGKQFEIIMNSIDYMIIHFAATRAETSEMIFFFPSQTLFQLVNCFNQLKQLIFAFITPKPKKGGKETDLVDCPQGNMSRQALAAPSISLPA